MLNAIAEKRGVPHHSHRDYDLLINRLFKEAREKEIVVWFRMAEGLHANFYHNFMDREEFELHREAVLNLVKRLRGLAAY